MRNVNDTGKSVVWLFALVIASSALASGSSAKYQVKPVSDEQAKEYGLDTSFYKKCTVVQNILIATSEGVSNHAHLEAAYQFDMIMKSINPEVAQRVRDRKVLCILIGHQKLTSELPQFASDTMGSAKDYESAGLRRLTINAAYWCLGMEKHIRTTSSVEYVGDYKPLPSGFNYEKLKVVPKKPEAYR